MGGGKSREVLLQVVLESAVVFALEVLELVVIVLAALQDVVGLVDLATLYG